MGSSRHSLGPLTAVALVSPAVLGTPGPPSIWVPNNAYKSFWVYPLMGFKLSYVTITAGFNASGDDAKFLLSTAWLFKVATHRVLSHVKSMHALPASKIGWKNMFRRVAYEVIPNRRYADSATVLVMSVYESCRQLGVDFHGVELDDWLIFQQSEKEYPPRNITLKSVDEVWVTVFGYNKESRRIKLRISASGSYKKLLEAILAERQPYNPRIVIRSWNIRRGEFYVRGELQVAVPLDFYYKHMIRYRQNNGGLYGGVDVNSDRINLAIVDDKGDLRDTYTFWFREVTARGYPRHRVRTIMGMRVHEMLKYAYHHGVKTLFLENPEVLGRLRHLWIRNGRRLHSNYNWKVSVFRSSVIEIITYKAPLYAINVRYVNPKGTTHSKGHHEAMKKFGLDKHSASAYMIALKGLKLP